MRFKPTLIAVAVALIGVAAGVGLTHWSKSSKQGVDVSGVPLGAVSCAWMRTQAVTTVVYPGATILRTSCQASTGRSDDFASETTYFTTSATGADVYQWYDSRVAAMGWSYVNDTGCYNWQQSCPAYQPNGWTPSKPKREVFGVAIDNPRILTLGTGITPSAACTVFETDLVVFPPSSGHAVPAPKWARYSGGHSCWSTGGDWVRNPPN